MPPAHFNSGRTERCDAWEGTLPFIGAVIAADSQPAGGKRLVLFPQQIQMPERACWLPLLRPLYSALLTPTFSESRSAGVAIELPLVMREGVVST